jgi:prolyl oligopeptidase
MKNIFFLLLILFLNVDCVIFNSDYKIVNGEKSESEKFHELLSEQWEKGIIRNPEWASSLGDNRFNDKLNDTSYETILKRQGETRELQETVKKIDRSKLSEDDQLNYDLYFQGIEKQIEGFQFLSYLIPIDQMGGIQIGFAGIPNYMPFNNVKDYENYLARMRAFPTKLDQTIDLMKRGVKEGWVPPKIILVSVPDQIKAQFEKMIEESPLFKPFKDFPESIPSEEQTRLIDEMVSVLTEYVYPAYETLYSYFIESYLPSCGESIACKDFPNGDVYYKYQIKSYTTTNLTAEEIHQIGLGEVDRIRAEMKKVINMTEFKGSFDEFLTFLRTDSQFYFTSEDELLNEYRMICKKADAELPKFFGLLPRLPYGVKPIPDYQAPASPTAYYYSGSQEAGRAGFFMANTYKLETRPKYEMEALSIHEAVPGHHLQITLAQELENIPKFRRYGGYTAFVEGWGLYSEKLAEEMGFYEDPYSKFGQLTYEMWRACRLVVDTGMHTLGWTRQEAIDFMLSNTAKTENDVTVEIDRYIAWPGQALAYKIGELKIRELRSKAEKEMGENFNIRDFHDVVLGHGAVPLDILEKHVNEYILQIQ